MHYLYFITLLIGSGKIVIATPAEYASHVVKCLTTVAPHALQFYQKHQDYKHEKEQEKRHELSGGESSRHYSESRLHTAWREETVRKSTTRTVEDTKTHKKTGTRRSTTRKTYEEYTEPKHKSRSYHEPQQESSRYKPVRRREYSPVREKYAEPRRQISYREPPLLHSRSESSTYQAEPRQLYRVHTETEYRPSLRDRRPDTDRSRHGRY